MVCPPIAVKSIHPGRSSASIRPGPARTPPGVCCQEPPDGVKINRVVTLLAGSKFEQFSIIFVNHLIYPDRMVYGTHNSKPFAWFYHAKRQQFFCIQF
jgi:hypothetical protein